MCLKSLFSVVFGVLRCITTYLSRPRAGIPAVDGGKENDWQTEGWGDFSVTVIPNEKELHQAQDSSCSDLDVFSDMQPVIKRAKTVSAVIFFTWLFST